MGRAEETARLASFGGWPAILGRLMSGGDLTAVEARAALGEILAGKATEAQVASFLVALRTKGETADEMSGLAAAMFETAQPLNVGGDLLDTCGTGGDRSRSINVSTIAAFVVAGAGVRVCKHGNRAASSAAGSADVLEALGVAIDLGPEGVSACIEEAGMGFCFAQRFHPAMRHVNPVRKQLGVPTVFNYMGPLVNPARARYQIIGVNEPEMAERMISVLAANGTRRAMVVHGDDGLDELSTTSSSTVLELDATSGSNGQVRRYEVDPTDLGIEKVGLDAIRGGDADRNAEAARRVLDGKAGPHRDVVVLNAAGALVVSGRASGMTEGLALARASIDGGAALHVLDCLVRTSRAMASVED